MAGLTPLGVFGKWILAPVALAAAGYLFVGPHIGRSAATDKVGEEIRAALEHDSPKPSDNAVAPANNGGTTAQSARTGPSLDVSVLPVSDPPPQPVRHRRRHQTSTPKPATTAPTAPPAETPPVEVPDPASTNGGETGTTAG